uniref:Protein NATD1 isoform X1 n=1 Tax=Phascolarctos cinereus TaxID=38626 RepID=A0A6P5M023_PHACI|nr:protein NATD1 isoform X1 [Phascolarctos cinereus]
MAHSAQLNILEQNCPIQVEHDRKRRQFTVKLNAAVRLVMQWNYSVNRATGNPKRVGREGGRGMVGRICEMYWSLIPAGRTSNECSQLISCYHPPVSEICALFLPLCPPVPTRSLVGASVC